MGISTSPAAPGEKLLSRAQQVYGEAQEHKHLAAHHRRQAKKKLARFEAFKRRLEALNIEVVIESSQPIHPSPSRRTSDGDNQDAT